MARQEEDAEITKLKDEIATLCEQIDTFTAKESYHQERISSQQAVIADLTEAVAVSKEQLLVNARAAEDGANELARAQEVRGALEKVIEEVKAEHHELRLEAEALSNQLAAETRETYNNTSPAGSVAPASSSAMLSRARLNGAGGDEGEVVGGREQRKGSTGSLMSVDLLTDDEALQSRTASLSRDQGQHSDQEGGVFSGSLSSQSGVHTHQRQGAMHMNTQGSNLLAVKEVRHTSHQLSATLSCISVLVFRNPWCFESVHQ